MKIFAFIAQFATNPNVLACICAYLIAGIPFGLLLAKSVGGVDIKSEGSGSIGATNVLRVLRSHGDARAAKHAIATIVCDVLKGIVPILIARYALGMSYNTQLSMAVFAVLGHCFSPYLGFSGGKGVATGAGVLALFLPIEIAIAVCVWFVVGKVLKISSLASLCALFALLCSMFIFHASDLSVKAPAFIIAFIVLYKHIPNIKRLILREEKSVI